MPPFSYKNPTQLLVFPILFFLGFLCFCEVSQTPQEQRNPSPAAEGSQSHIISYNYNYRYNQSKSIMGLQSSVRAKRLWNVLKVTLILMARKGLISKRRFIMDMNLMVKRGKLFRKSVTNYFMFHHHHHSSARDMTRGGFSIQDYEFSCSNTPINPVFSHMSKRSTKNHTYFPCINLPGVMETRQQQEEEEEDSDPEVKTAFTLLPMTPENTLNHLQYNALSPAMEGGSPLVSPFNVRISNYSSEEENEISSDSGQVDNQAEDFIRRFYEQLKMQRRLQLLQYS